MTAPKINPKTGHEDGLPDPRPRNEILRELLASSQVDPQRHLYDALFHLQCAVDILMPHVDAEVARQSREFQRKNGKFK